MVLAILGEETQTLGMSATKNDQNRKEMEETTCLSRTSSSLLLLENMPSDKPLMMDFLQKWGQHWKVERQPKSLIYWPLNSAAFFLHYKKMGDFDFLENSGTIKSPRQNEICLEKGQPKNLISWHEWELSWKRHQKSWYIGHSTQLPPFARSTRLWHQQVSNLVGM